LFWPAAWPILDAAKGARAAVILLYLLAVYALAGLVTAVAFVVVGVEQVQPMPVTWGARILLLPGAFALWPLVLARWRKCRGVR
jgi:hypothetical protein